MFGLEIIEGLVLVKNILNRILKMLNIGNLVLMKWQNMIYKLMLNKYVNILNMIKLFISDTVKELCNFFNH